MLTKQTQPAQLHDWVSQSWIDNLTDTDMPLNLDSQKHFYSIQNY